MKRAFNYLKLLVFLGFGPLIDGIILAILLALLFSFAVCMPSCGAEIAKQSPEVAAHFTLKVQGETLTTPENGIVAAVGELVRLDLRDSVMGGIAWRVVPETPDFEVIELGRRALLSGRAPGTYTLMIAGAKDDQAFLMFTTVEITAEGAPVPERTLSEKIIEWGKLVPHYPKRKTHAAALAEVFRKIEKQELSVDKILEATALANSAVLGDDLDKWARFLDKLGTELDALDAAGKLSTREQYQTAWAVIAAGLDSV